MTIMVGSIAAGRQAWCYTVTESAYMTQNCIDGWTETERLDPAWAFKTPKSTPNDRHTYSNKATSNPSQFHRVPNI